MKTSSAALFCLVSVLSRESTGAALVVGWCSLLWELFLDREFADNVEDLSCLV